MNNIFIEYAKKTFLAEINPYNTVEMVFPLAIEKSQEGLFYGYIGVKNHVSVSPNVIAKLEENGFALHTRDKMALGGRAVDMDLRNPISGKPMSGSSSGTALNVFYGINDIGVGTDGGGSVINPALALNLLGFISKFLDETYSKQFQKTSTDGITFSPSNGFITRDFETMEKAVDVFFKMDNNEKKSDKVFKVGIPSEATDFFGVEIKSEIMKKLEKFSSDNFEIKLVGLDFDSIIGTRNQQIKFMQDAFEVCDFVISPEGPTDLYGLGDTVFGGMDEFCGEIQAKSGKALSKVANMVNANAIIVPTSRFARGYLISSAPKSELIPSMMEIAKAFYVERKPLLDSYFLNLDKYFQNGISVK